MDKNSKLVLTTNQMLWSPNDVTKLDLVHIFNTSALINNRE